ncbi:MULTISPECIES: PhzF family phenazine biosynthesis protein [unclassified Duganella]|uniref:PhzF family phenazine biosynthesis protein n=1 Tax=unclassified Duganella TaxID=2636909 RepID=UPI000E34E590|nr:MULTISPECIES: PhzF family phenazine biosynthesis protein [unclassified Duganella]RFP14937.1 PhzF family phenazine biosynthesis protein [Duganella sp. BJB475]RFP31287.1 PhzF family phenazine biosynthesis protein [Duganella sp. BJB476]
MQTITKIHKVAAFTAGELGGNPAGVMIRSALPEESAMQRIAAEMGYSETVFAAPTGDGWRVRYFSPDGEIPFCGHATIALGAVLAQQNGDGIFPLTTNHARVTVEAQSKDGQGSAALQSPATASAPAPAALVTAALALFGYSLADLDDRIPPAIANGGANHLVLALASREQLRAMRYQLADGRSLMRQHGLATISLVHAETLQRFHARNPFASGGVYEDPATGAAAAALGGYLRDLDWPHGGAIDIIQGEDMGAPCHLRVEISRQAGSSIRVSGNARMLGD